MVCFACYLFGSYLRKAWKKCNGSIYSFDDKEYTMMRNAQLQDNTPAMVGLMAACSDGNGFNATFERFSVKHLPDQRRLDWLKKNAGQ